MSKIVPTHEQSGMTMVKIRFLVIGMVGMSLLIACIPFFLPETPGSKTDGFLELAIVGLVLSSFAIVAAILFVLGMKGFKDEFKKTYYYLCTGLAIQAVALLVYPTALYIGIWDDKYVNIVNFVGNSIYLSGTVPIFIGLRRFSRLLQAKTRLSNPLYVGMMTIGLALLLWLTPHTPIKIDELSFNLLQTANSAEGILSFFCALLVWKIRGQASLFYSHPLQWLAIALMLDTFGDVFYFTANQIVTPSGIPDPNLTSLSGIVFLASRVVYLFAGYSLIRLTHKEEVPQKDGSPVDVIVYMASLVSKKADIDPMLDKLRSITASMAEDKKLSGDQRRSLEILYARLQDYLLNREPLLALTEESLNRKLQHKFGVIPFTRAKYQKP